MEEQKWHEVWGVVTKGYGVASGIGPDSPYPLGSVVMQKPFFEERGLSLEDLHLATINVDLSPYEFEIFNPEFKFERVKWYEAAPVETFSFSRCFVKHEHRKHRGYVYYPHPETKIAHFQSKSTIEVIAPYLEGISHGTRLLVYLNPAEIRLSPMEEETHQT